MHLEYEECFLFLGGGFVRCKEAVAQGGGYVEKMALSLHGRKRAATEGGCPADGGKNQCYIVV